MRGALRTEFEYNSSLQNISYKKCCKNKKGGTSLYNSSFQNITNKNIVKKEGGTSYIHFENVSCMIITYTQKVE